jgi:hypothetical protein
MLGVRALRSAPVDGTAAAVVCSIGDAVTMSLPDAARTQRIAAIVGDGALNVRSAERSSAAVLGLERRRDPQRR